MRVAVISVGTNSCRLLLAEGDPGALRIAYQESRGTRIGEGVDATGRIDPAAAERTLAVVRDYTSLASGVDRAFGIATSALRDAKDGDAFARAFDDLTGSPLDVLSGEEEALCSFEGALAGLRSAGRDVPAAVTVIDVGGGSTEVATRTRSDAPPSVASLQLGAVRLTEQFLPGDPPSAGDVDRCRIAIRTALATLPDAVRPRPACVAVGGTANTALRVMQLVDEHAQGVAAAIGADDLHALVEATLAMPLAMRKRMHGLPAQRADIFPAGLMILDESLRASGASELTVTDSDLLLGYATRKTKPRS